MSEILESSRSITYCRELTSPEFSWRGTLLMKENLTCSVEQASSPPKSTEAMRTMQIQSGTGLVMSTSSQSSYSNSWKNSPPWRCVLVVWFTTRLQLPVVRVVRLALTLLAFTLPAPRVGVDTWIYLKILGRNHYIDDSFGVMTYLKTTSRILPWRHKPNF